MHTVCQLGNWKTRKHKNGNVGTETWNRNE